MTLLSHSSGRCILYCWAASDKRNFLQDFNVDTRSCRGLDEKIYTPFGAGLGNVTYLARLGCLVSPIGFPGDREVKCD